MSEKEEVNLIDKIEKAKWERRYLNVLREIEEERKGIIMGWIYCEEEVEGSMETSWKKRWFSLSFQFLSIFKRKYGLLLFFFSILFFILIYFILFYFILFCLFFDFIFI